MTSSPVPRLDDESLARHDARFRGDASPPPAVDGPGSQALLAPSSRGAKSLFEDIDAEGEALRVVFDDVDSADYSAKDIRAGVRAEQRFCARSF